MSFRAQIRKNKQIRHRTFHRSGGNVLFLILIAVALFAALSYAVTQSSRGGGNADSETLALEAARLVQYTSSISVAIQRLMLGSGCSESEISFHYDSDGDGTLETNGDDDYYNPNSPVDLSCHIFQANGGGLYYTNDFPALREHSVLTSGDFWDTYDFLFISFNHFEGVGTTGGGASSADLHLILPQLTQEACEEINNSLGITGANFQDSDIALGVNSTDLFDGGYGENYNRAIFDEAVGADMVGQYVGCMDELAGTDSAGYHYFHILLAR